MSTSSFTERRLKFLATKIGSGKTPTGGAEAYVDTGVTFLRSQNIHIDGLRLDDVVHIDDETDREMQGTRVWPADSLLNITGASLGRVALAPDKLGRANLNQHVCIVRPVASVDHRYLSWSLQGLAVQQQIFALQVGGNRDGLNFEQVGNLSALLPALDEQRRIADFLDIETARIGSLVAGHREARLVLLERRASSIFRSVTGQNDAEQKPSSLVWVETLPLAWPAVKLGHVARMGSGHTPSRSRQDWWTNCTIPWITTGEVSQVRDDRREVLDQTRECISELGMANSSAELHPQGTVVLCRTASAGYSAVMGQAMATSQDFVIWTCGTRLEPFYLLWCLRAMRNDLLGRLAMGSTHKTIYVPDLQMLRIPLPELDAQNRIVADIRRSNATIDAAVDSIDRQLALLAERRQALITAAVTGEFDVSTAGGLKHGAPTP